MNLKLTKKMLHKQGPQLWNDSAVAIDANSVHAIASDTHDGLIKVKSLKEANACWEWDYFRDSPGHQLS